jgi:diaminohydroxyphosphoribosylaminopyrimidine deaminase/5-amino-6-(5-phosphoribosylamino)uracil reductase
MPTTTTEGKVDLSAALTELGRRDITSVVIEAGPTLNFEALRSDCVDKLLCFIAPRILGRAVALATGRWGRVRPAGSFLAIAFCLD